MSTLKVDTIESKTLNGDITVSSLLSGSGASLTNLPAGNLTGTVADARISTLTASKLTGALPAISGASLTGLASSTEYAYIETYYDSSTTGTMALTGAGFTPKFVLIFLGQGSTTECSIGCAASTSASQDSSLNFKPAGTWTIQPELAFMIEGGSPEKVTRLTVSSFDSDGITLNKLKNNSPTGTVLLSAFLFA
jgi:hypothetical protein